MDAKVSPDRKKHHVVIVPGLGDTPASIRALVAHLEGLGLPVHVFTYPAKEWTIDRTALVLASFVEREVLQSDPACSVSFVGMGTGTLVQRYYLTHYEVLPARRCVLVADMFHPSDRYRGKRPGWLAKRRFGVALTQLAEGPEGFPVHCGVPPIPFGVLVTGAPEAPEATNTQSIYAPAALLQAARAVTHTRPGYRRALQTPHVLDLISTFLLHGWFTER